MGTAGVKGKASPAVAVPSVEPDTWPVGTNGWAEYLP